MSRSQLLLGMIVLIALMVPMRGTAQEVESDRNLLGRVNEWPIYREDLEQVLSNLHREAQAGDRPAFDLDTLIHRRLVGDALLAAEAAALGMDSEPPIPRRLATLRHRMARERLEQEAIFSRIEVDDDAVRQLFAAEYRTVTTHMATLATREEAEEFLAQARAGTDFETLARERSIDPRRQLGGLAPPIPFVNLAPEIAATLFSLQPGQLSPPLLTEAGWAVFRVDELAEADEAVFAEVEERIRGILRLRQADELRQALLDDLAAAHSPTLDDQAIAAIGCERRADGGLWPVVPDPEAILVRIGERRIRAEDLGKALLDRWRTVTNEEAALASKPLILDRLIGDELVLVEALSRGYGDSPQVQRARHALMTRLLVRKYLNEVLSESVEISVQEMERYYEEHESEFRKPPKLRIGQITVATREEGERIASLLRGGADLAWLARQHSIDRFRDAGGDRGWVVAGMPLEPFGRQLAEGRPGQVFGPEGWEDNFVVVRVTAVEDQGPYSFREVSGNVRSIVYSSKFRELLDKTFNKLRERAEIELIEDHIESLDIGVTAATPGAEPSHGDH